MKPLVLAMLAVALLGGGMFLGRQLFSVEDFAPDPAPPSASPSASPSPSPTAPEGFVVYEDAEAGFSLAYPKTWNRLESADPQIRLIATPNQRDSLLVRVFQPGFAVTADNLHQARTLTDSLVDAGRGVKILAEPEQITLGGLPGYFYFYTFKDSETGKKGVHSHYFLFDGETMVTIVFQALPAPRFPRLAPVFDEIANSFRAGS